MHCAYNDSIKICIFAMLMRKFNADIRHVAVMTFLAGIALALTIPYAYAGGRKLDSLELRERNNLQLADGKLYLPLDRYKVSSPYGYRRHPKTHKMHFHSAIDLDARWGDPVYAAEKGVVKFAGWKGKFGYYIIIDHGRDSLGNTFSTAYAHLSRFYVRKSDLVEAGQMIGKVGSTGRSTGSHLHFEVYENNIRKNPAVFFRHHELSEFSKYQVGGARRMRPVASIEPLIPLTVNFDVPVLLPEPLPRHKSEFGISIPLRLLLALQSAALADHIPQVHRAPLVHNELAVQTHENPKLLAGKDAEIGISAAEAIYGVQICASLKKLDASRKNAINKRHRGELKEDFDGEYYRYTLVSAEGWAFTDENEVRHYIRKLQRDEVMGVIKHENQQRITLGWE